MFWNVNVYFYLGMYLCEHVNVPLSLCVFVLGVSAHSCVRVSVECVPVHFSMCDMCVVGM